MTLDVKPFDVADLLEDEVEILAFLNGCVEETPDDAAFIVQVLGTAARARGNMSAFARTVGVSREGLYKALSSSGNPSFANVLKMIAALGLAIRFVPRAVPKKRARAKTAAKRVAKTANKRATKPVATKRAPAKKKTR